MRKSETAQLMARLDKLEELLDDVLKKLDGPGKLAYSVTEAAEALGVSRNGVYDLIHREGFPSLPVGGRRLISAELLREWVRDQARKGGAG